MTHPDVAGAIERARELSARPGRALLGLAGAPGSGKSTLAAELADRVPGAVVVPMDGFHLPTAVLASLGRVERRGAPDTFDADGYVALLRALRSADGPVRAPLFDRSREEPVPDALEIPADCPLVITEGNYLLLDDPPWSQLGELLDECWFVELPEADRVERLTARFVAYGMPPDAARDRVVRGSDAVNARLVAATRARADRVVQAADVATDLADAGVDVADAGAIRRLDSREVYRNPWLRMHEDEVEFPNGTRGHYAVVEKPDFALVLPRDNDGFWMVQQYRYPIGRREWEFPQGGWPAGRSGTPAELAAAELREETGLRAEHLTHLGHLFAAYGFCSQGYDVFLATGLTPGAPHRESTESDMVHAWRSDAEVRAMLRSGELADAHSLAALALYDHR